MKSIRTMICIVLFAAVAPALLCSRANAVEPKTVGYAKIEELMSKHPMIVKWKKEFDSIKTKREKDVEKKIIDKVGIKDKNNMTDAQKNQARMMLASENERFANEMQSKNDEKLKKAEDDIKTAAAAVASKKNLTLILDRSVVVFGGVDVTNDILDIIKKKYASK